MAKKHGTLLSDSSINKHTHNDGSYECKVFASQEVSRKERDNSSELTSTVIEILRSPSVSRRTGVIHEPVVDSMHEKRYHNQAEDEK